MTLLSNTLSLTTPLLHSPLLLSASLLTILLLLTFLYNTTRHPLSPFPRLPLAHLSPIYLHTLCYLGIEGRVLRSYHLKHKTKVLRVSPNSVSISDPAAIAPIYISSGGFPKDERYRNFNLGPIVSIFSAIDPGYRDRRAKAVAPLFASQRLRVESGDDGAIGSHVIDFVEKLQACKAAQVRTDILDLCARLSIDVVTSYLLGESYGGLHEFSSDDPREWQGEQLSANAFIFAIVAFSRFSLLPNWMFKMVYNFSTWVSKNDAVVQSFILMDKFIEKVMSHATEAKDCAFPSVSVNGSTYQSRLLQAGITPAEAAAQSKAIVFAGADSTAVMLATAIFHIIRNPEIRSRLEEEQNLHARTDSTNSEQATESPYLRATIKETLRLGMANPTRLTRIIPPNSSLKIDDVVLPAGTVVGCAAYTLHHDPDIFPEPFEFRPERWLDSSSSNNHDPSLQKGHNNGLKKDCMDRSILAFGAGARACLGKALAMRQLEESLKRVVRSGVLKGARTCEERIEV